MNGHANLALAGLVAAALPASSVWAQEGAVRIIETPEVSQPGPFSTRGHTVVMPRTQIDVGGMPGGASAAVPAGTVIAGKVREVIDAGTLEVGGRRLRLYGLDAPAAGATCKAAGQYWSCGRDAAFALAYETAEHWLNCEVKGRDDDGTPLAACAVGPHDLGAVLVGQGWALADRRLSAGYAAEEAAARQAQAGLWRGGFTPPRKGGGWQQAESGRPSPPPSAGKTPAEPGACLIKGNISSKGERIYHVPGGHFYDVTRIDPTKGERWFCSEAEARAAGWRRSKR